MAQYGNCCCGLVRQAALFIGRINDAGMYQEISLLKSVAQWPGRAYFSRDTTRGHTVNWRSTIYHDGSEFFRSPTNPSLGDSVTITLRVSRKAPLKKVFLRINPDGEQDMLPMEDNGCEGDFRYFRVLVGVTRTPFYYRFFLLNGDSGFWFNEAGCSNLNPLDCFDFRVHATDAAPPWLAETVFYQVFPDRFANGAPELNVRDGEYEYRGKKPRLRAWDDVGEAGNSNEHLDFYGGDLIGIEQHLDHIQELGANALYLTPVFESPSNHKYDTQDYDRIDPHFGSNDDFARLTGALHQRGMRVILDGVFNHVGIAHKWFNRAGFYEGGAYQDPDSPYREFFIFRHYPDDYACWKGIESLPKLNFASRKLRDAVYRSPNGVALRWLDHPWAIDGWRLDVANMLGRNGAQQIHHEVWREFRAALKARRPDCFILGEHFFDPSDLLDGDMLDSVMNYQGFTFPVWRWLSREDSFLSGWERVRFPVTYTASDLAAQMRLFRARVGYDTSLRMFNLLNSHDTPRFLSILQGDRDRYRIALTLLFTYPGIPCIFYGDEIGMEGAGDPDCRRPMIWDRSQWDMNLLETYRRLIGLRRENKALCLGGILELVTSATVFAYARIYGEKTVVVAVRQGDEQETVSLPLCRLGLQSGTMRDFYSGQEYSFQRGCLKLDMAACDSAVLEYVDK